METSEVHRLLHVLLVHVGMVYFCLPGARWGTCLCAYAPDLSALLCRNNGTWAQRKSDGQLRHADQTGTCQYWMCDVNPNHWKSRWTYFMSSFLKKTVGYNVPLFRDKALQITWTATHCATHCAWLHKAKRLFFSSPVSWVSILLCSTDQSSLHLMNIT